MSDGEYGLQESFHIDNGELDGFRPNEIFVLGYELAMISGLGESQSDPIAKTVHAANHERIDRALENRGWECRWQFPHDDVSESWVYLVAVKKESEDV